MSTYEQTATIVGNANRCGFFKVTAHIKHSGIRVDHEAFDQADHDYSVNRANLILCTVRRARRVYFRMFGKRAP